MAFFDIGYWVCGKPIRTFYAKCGPFSANPALILRRWVDFGMLRIAIFIVELSYMMATYPGEDTRRWVVLLLRL